MNKPPIIHQYSDIYTSFTSNLLFPLHEKLKKHITVAALKKLEKSQWQSPSSIEQLQIKRLRELLSHAQAHVPYYRNIFNDLDFDP